VLEIQKRAKQTQSFLSWSLDALPWLQGTSSASLCLSFQKPIMYGLPSLPCCSQPDPSRCLFTLPLHQIPSTFNLYTCFSSCPRCVSLSSSHLLIFPFSAQMWLLLEGGVFLNHSIMWHSPHYPLIPFINLLQFECFHLFTFPYPLETTTKVSW
jgi:hypothetical protein